MFSRLELRNLMTRPELFIMKSDFSATVRMPHVSDIMHPHFRKTYKTLINKWSFGKKKI